jgi:hypothetical protein
MTIIELLKIPLDERCDKEIQAWVDLTNWALPLRIEFGIVRFFIDIQIGPLEIVVYL